MDSFSITPLGSRRPTSMRKHVSITSVSCRLLLQIPLAHSCDTICDLVSFPAESLKIPLKNLHFKLLGMGICLVYLTEKPRCPGSEESFTVGAHRSDLLPWLYTKTKFLIDFYPAFLLRKFTHLSFQGGNSNVLIKAGNGKFRECYL